ncbi:GAF domain-containing protein [Kribbella sp. NPDC050124]|uniref:GAF domain-containing protein n=1 Tax=Kribbella sp. NPDC050124 TaxID=3364114 RepID=UPI0037A988B6
MTMKQGVRTAREAHPLVEAVTHARGTPYALLIVGTVATTVTGFPDSWIWRGAALAVGVLALTAREVVGTARARATERQLMSAREAAIQAKTNLTVMLQDAFEPIAEVLGRIAACRTKADRDKLTPVLVEKVVGVAASICGPSKAGQTRSCYFKCEDGQLKFLTYDGRGGKPRHQNLPPQAYDLAQKRKSGIEPDVRSSADPTLFLGASYRTYISCPVYAGDEVLGLLTVDAVEPHTLSKQDLRSTEVLAHMLGAGLATRKLPPAGA